MVEAANRRQALQAAIGNAYAIERELGRGGMATVYLARDAKHNRLVALKVLHANLAASLGPDRFRREITFAATLQHPHILTVLDSGEMADEQLWFTMPYVEGESLRDRLRSHGPLALEDALRIAREAADALEYAHSHGVIHRDIKPENILLSGTHALVADFGIARALATESDGAPLTVTGLAVGTPAYMSPEQASADRSVDARTDLYSLGIVLYEMLAGEPPYAGPTAHAVIAKMMGGELPPLRRVRPSVPEAVWTIVQKALALVPADRYTTAAAFGAALASAERALMISSTASTAKAGRTSTRMWIAGLCVLVGLGAIFAWQRRAPSATERAGPPTVAVLPFENVGDSSDAYFADGITDEIRGKLAGLHGLRVIASTSSGQYRHSSKTTQEIARELGAQYVLLGRVRWQRSTAGTSRVRVDPELVQVPGSGPAATAWQQAFEADLRDVFQVQSDIAGRVAEQLRVTLGSDEQHALVGRPTANLNAYDAYLRGNELGAMGSSSQQERRAARAYREAVQRDSTFAIAWAQLGNSYVIMYANGVPSPSLRDSADRATSRALALAPDLPEAHAARGLFYSVTRLDFAGALAEFETGLARSPYNARLLRYASRAEASLNRWDAALQHVRDAAQIDPRDAQVFSRMGEFETRRRDYPAARRAIDRAAELAPQSLKIIEERV
ncbi:MAG: protein kinase, partial [Gemmatimonadaceae bacterium]